MTGQRPAFPPVLALAVGVLGISTASTWVRLAQRDLPSLGVAAWRLTLAALILAPPALWPRRTAHGWLWPRPEWRGLSHRVWGWLVASGVFLALHFYLWITSLALTSVAASVVLVTTNPLFVAVIAHFVLGERLTARMVKGMVMAFAGAVIIGLGDMGEGMHRPLGDVLALAGAVAVAAYMLIGRRLRARLSLLGYIFPVYATAAVVLMGVAVIAGVPLLAHPPRTWLWLLLLALIPQLMGHSSFNWALRHLPATYVALSVLAEPVGATLLAWAVLGESPTMMAVMGGMLTLGGLALAGTVGER